MKKAFLLASLIVGFSAAAHADCAESKPWIVKLIELRTPVGSASTVYFPSGRLAKNGDVACVRGTVPYANGSVASTGAPKYPGLEEMMDFVGLE